MQIARDGWRTKALKLEFSRPPLVAKGISARRFAAAGFFFVTVL
jgi:hypothetical protein